LGFKQNGKALSTLSIALIIVGVVLIVVGTVVALFIFYSSDANQKTVDYSNTDFTALDVSSAFNVKVVYADSFSIKVTADEHEFDRIVVTQNGETLKIEMKSGFSFLTHGPKAEISMPALENLTLSGASKGSIDGFNSVNPFIVKLSGASTLDVTNSVFGDVTAGLSGASRLVAQGAGGNLTCNVSGASNMDLTSFQVNDATVTLSGASQAVVNTTGTLNVDLSGASSMQYLGNPTLGDVNISGASSFNKK
jgi:hypothetical protein